MNKLCNKCNIEKPVEAFSKQKASLDGLFFCCKECYTKHYWKPAKVRRHEAITVDRNVDSRKRNMLKQKPPNLDESLHIAYIKATEQLAKLSASDDLTNNDIAKMRDLIGILLNIKKRARPIFEEKEDPKDSDEFFK